MQVQEKAPERSAQALAEAFAPVVSRQPTYIILDAACQDCDTACQEREPQILPLTDIAQQLRDAAVQRLAQAHQALEEAQTRIARERARREQQLEIVRATLAVVEQQSSNLEQERATYEKQAQTFLAGAAREQMLAQIHLSFNARELELEAQVQEAQRARAELNYEHYAAIIGEELELQLLGSDVETLQQAAPEAAAQVEHEHAAPQHLANALQLARNGAVQEAERELALARSGKLKETEIAAAETAIADAKRRALARELIAEIQSVSAELPGATAQLKRLAQRAHEQKVYENVESFLHRALKQARAAATARYREAVLHADYLAEQGFIPCIGDGRIEAWQPTQHGWTLVQMLTYQQDTWVTHHPRARVTRTEIPRRVRRSPWFKKTTDHRFQTTEKINSSSFVHRLSSDVS